MTDVCSSLGIKKLNTAVYHPQCDGIVEHFSQTLKTILRKHAMVVNGIDRVQEFYGHTKICPTNPLAKSHLFGMDCRTPSEAAHLKSTDLHPTNVDDYREEMKLVITSARKLAATNIQKAQKKYKAMHDK